MPSRLASSARGGRSSAPNTEVPDCSAERRSCGMIAGPARAREYTMRSVTLAAVRAALARVPAIRFAPQPTPVEALPRLAAMIGAGPRLFVKRDDAIPFAFGGNKVRKLAFVAARAQADGADTLITAGGVQSNHARVTAAVAAKLGCRAVLVVNGTPPPHATANLLLDRLLGAEVDFVESRDHRTTRMRELADRLRQD